MGSGYSIKNNTILDFGRYRMFALNMHLYQIFTWKGAPSVNKGKIRTSGYELELRINKTFANDLRLWGNFRDVYKRQV